MSEYNKKKVDVSRHKRHDPRIQREVDVKDYQREQEIKIYRPISKAKSKPIPKSRRDETLRKWLEDDTNEGIKGLDTRTKKEEFIAYYGTKPHKTMIAIALDNTIPVEKKGVAVEIGDGYKDIERDIKFLEDLGLLIMVDNGSFKYSQRCPIFNSKKISEKKLITPEEYFNYENAEKRSDWIVQEYEKVLKNSKNPEKQIIILPELIGSSEITNKLHKRHRKKFEELQKKYNCGVWATLQFNPQSADWKREAQDSIDDLEKLNMPDSWKIGVPYGKDFGLLWRGKKAKDNRKFLFNELSEDMKNKVHLYGCGSISKVEGVKNYRDVVTSIDSSSINAMSRYAHYLNPKYKQLQDIRSLKGKTGTEATIQAHRQKYTEASNLPLKVWTEERDREYFNMLSRFIINFQHFNQYIEEEIM